MLKKATEDKFIERFEPAASPKAVTLLFHGFPGEEKNTDLAQHLADSLGHLAIVPHHTGLGKSGGQFSFLNSILQGRAFWEALAQEYADTPLNLIGHSWGGLIAINAITEATKARLHKLVLMAPFNSFPDSQLLAEFIKLYRAEMPTIFANYPIDKVLQDLERVQAEFHPRKTLPLLALDPEKLLFVQGEKDDTVLPESTRELHALAANQAQYIEVPDDHKFSADRAALITCITQFLAN